MVAGSQAVGNNGVEVRATLGKANRTFLFIVFLLKKVIEQVT